MGLTMENYNIFGVHWKIWFLGGGGVPKNQYKGGNCLKGGGLGKFTDLRGALARKRGVDTLMHTMNTYPQWVDCN